MGPLVRETPRAGGILVPTASERRRDYMVSRRVHALYMLMWIASLALVAAFGFLAYTLLGLRAQVGPSGANGLILVGALSFVIVASALTLGVYAIVHTHRMIGSAYHISTYLERVNTGQTADALTLRDGDYFKEIADEINRLRQTPGTTPADAAPKT